MTARARQARGGTAGIRLLTLIGGGAFATAVGLEITNQPLAGEVVAAALGGVAQVPVGRPARPALRAASC